MTITMIVQRASKLRSVNPPCPEAFIAGQKQIDRETIIPVYNISFETLDQLMEFVKENNEIVLSEDRVIIYDDYIE